jgi:hypothetical protein
LYRAYAITEIIGKKTNYNCPLKGCIKIKPCQINEVIEHIYRIHVVHLVKQNGIFKLFDRKKNDALQDEEIHYLNEQLFFIWTKLSQNVCNLNEEERKEYFELFIEHCEEKKYFENKI